MIATHTGWYIAVQRLMGPVLVVVALELCKFSLKILRVPEQRVIEVFTTNRSDQSRNKGMRSRGIGDAFDFLDPQNPQVGPPSMIAKQRVIVRTEVVRNTLPGNGGVEQTAQGDTIDIAGVDAKANDTPRTLIHDKEHPVGFQQNGFAAKQIHAPEAVFCALRHRIPAVWRVWSVDAQGV